MLKSIIILFLVYGSIYTYPSVFYPYGEEFSNELNKYADQYNYIVDGDYNEYIINITNKIFKQLIQNEIRKIKLNVDLNDDISYANITNYANKIYNKFIIFTNQFFNLEIYSNDIANEIINIRKYPDNSIKQLYLGILKYYIEIYNCYCIEYMRIFYNENYPEIKYPSYTGPRIY